MSNQPMSQVEGYSGKHLLLAFIGGAVAGAVTALLTAPASGAETRERLRSGGKRGRDAVRYLPEALKAAGLAAEEAFVAALSPPPAQTEPTE